MELTEQNVYNLSMVFKYTYSSSSNSLERKQVEKSSRRDVSIIENFFRNVFLPEGYPDAVSCDYIYYQIWDTVQAFASSISGSLATQAVLEGVGVGDETATPLAATLTWLMRHGAGMVGQIAFTWLEGSDLDHNCKKWRLFADVLNDSALCLELSGPLWPSWCFQFILCIAGLCRALVGVAGGATRTAITQHQARANNISDVAAKDGSQETLVNLAALLVNLAILPLLAGDKFTIWILFFVLTGLHLFANFKAVKCLHFNTLNQARIMDLLRRFCKDGVILTPDVINENESVILGLGLSDKDACGTKINLGASLQKICQHQKDHKQVLSKIEKEFEKEPFVVFESKSANEVDVIVSDHCQPEDLLRAYVTAFIKSSGQVKQFNNSDYQKLEQKLVAAGWKTSHLQMNTLGWTVGLKKSN